MRVCGPGRESARDSDWRAPWPNHAGCISINGVAAPGRGTLLTGVLDRSGLYGVLAEVEALGLDLIEIRRLHTEDR